MDVLLVSSEKDVWLALNLRQAFAEAGCNASIFHPDLGNDAPLFAEAMGVMQRADYFVYLITPNSENSNYVHFLSPENIAPLCAVGVKIILIVAGNGSLPSSLAYLPCLYMLDEELQPGLISGLVEAIVLVDAILPEDLFDLRYGSQDLEAFLETAQGLSMAYTGIESAWDEMGQHDEESAKALFQRYASDVSFGVNFISHARLEKRAGQQSDYKGPITKILSDYRLLERDWFNIEKSFNVSNLVRETILAARCRTAVFANLIYLIMTLKLQPFCDQYLHMHGLMQKLATDTHVDYPVDAAQERLSFLISSVKKRP